MEAEVIIFPWVKASGCVLVSARIAEICRKFQVLGYFGSSETVVGNGYGPLGVLRTAVFLPFVRLMAGLASVARFAAVSGHSSAWWFIRLDRLRAGPCLESRLAFAAFFL